MHSKLFDLVYVQEQLSDYLNPQLRTNIFFEMSFMEMPHGNSSAVISSAV